MRTLKTIAGALLAVLFLISWVGGVSAWFYAVYNTIRGRSKPSHQSKVLTGMRVFRAFWLFGMLVVLTGFVLALWLKGTINR
jgi:hypothetical protein